VTLEAWVRRGLSECAGTTDTIDDAGTVRSIKPVSVFEVTQTQERTQRAAA
jgi:hypothetical protein